MSIFLCIYTCKTKFFSYLINLQTFAIFHYYDNILCVFERFLELNDVRMLKFLHKIDLYLNVLVPLSTRTVYLFHSSNLNSLFLKQSMFYLFFFISWKSGLHSTFFEILQFLNHPFVSNNSMNKTFESHQRVLCFSFLRCKNT